VRGEASLGTKVRVGEDARQGQLESWNDRCGQGLIAFESQFLGAHVASVGDPVHLDDVQVRIDNPVLGDAKALV
jgi:hypothetical protein